MATRPRIVRAIISVDEHDTAVRDDGEAMEYDDAP